MSSRNVTFSSHVTRERSRSWNGKVDDFELDSRPRLGGVVDGEAREEVRGLFCRADCERDVSDAGGCEAEPRGIGAVEESTRDADAPDVDAFTAGPGDEDASGADASS
jgi:hypothetical protein